MADVRHRVREVPFHIEVPFRPIRCFKSASDFTLAIRRLRFFSDFGFRVCMSTLFHEENARTRFKKGWDEQIVR